MLDTVSSVGIWCPDQAFEVSGPPGSVTDGTYVRFILEVPPKQSRVMKKFASQQLSILHLMTKTCLIFNLTVYLPQCYCFCGQAECTNRMNTNRVSTVGLPKL